MKEVKAVEHKVLLWRPKHQKTLQLDIKSQPICTKRISARVDPLNYGSTLALNLIQAVSEDWIPKPPRPTLHRNIYQYTLHLIEEIIVI